MWPLGCGSADAMACVRWGAMSDTEAVAPDELLHRRIHPTFQKPDGTVSSQAFTDNELSVDRAALRTAGKSLENFAGHGLVGFSASSAVALGLAVRAAPVLLNPAHAEVVGNKTKSVARALARASCWVVQISTAP